MQALISSYPEFPGTHSTSALSFLNRAGPDRTQPLSSICRIMWGSVYVINFIKDVKQREIGLKKNGRGSRPAQTGPNLERQVNTSHLYMIIPLLPLPTSLQPPTEMGRWYLAPPTPQGFTQFSSFSRCLLTPQLWFMSSAEEFNYLFVLYSQLLTFHIYPGVLSNKEPCAQEECMPEGKMQLQSVMILNISVPPSLLQLELLLKYA